MATRRTWTSGPRPGPPKRDLHLSPRREVIEALDAALAQIGETNRTSWFEARVEEWLRSRPALGTDGP